MGIWLIRVRVVTAFFTWSVRSALLETQSFLLFQTIERTITADH